MKRFVFIRSFAPELIALLAGIVLTTIDQDLKWAWLSVYALLLFYFVTRWIPHRIARWRQMKAQRRRAQGFGPRARSGGARSTGSR